MNFFKHKLIPKWFRVMMSSIYLTMGLLLTLLGIVHREIYGMTLTNLNVMFLGIWVMTIALIYDNVITSRNNTFRIKQLEGKK